MNAAPTIEGRLVRLRHVREDDLEAIRHIRSDRDVREAILASPTPETPEQQRSWFEHLPTNADQLIFVIAAERDDRVLGVIGLYNISRHHGHAEWGFYLGAHGLRNGGAAVEAELLLLDHAFGVEGLHRIYCRVLSTRPRTVSMHQRFGFAVEGMMPAHAATRRGFEDVIFMGIDAARYSKNRAAVAAVIQRLFGSSAQRGAEPR